eukprot:TRINITY_DN7266_c0_g1_i1.p1 TRINITY_DN7266_c0_g1~~TRINITY_DN7266_c0_g1_i1.p1  ORF type:complete len:352 (-),score=26.77 TRINITY_DN7266_c0_g1_i1:283-1338(-)
MVKNIFAFLVLTSLSCILGYFAQLFIQNAYWCSQVTKSLRYVANELESRHLPPTQPLRKTSSFNKYNPTYSSLRSLKNRREEYLKLCDRYSDPMRPESLRQEPIYDAFQGFLTHSLAICSPKHNGAGKWLSNLNVQSMTSRPMAARAFKNQFRESLKRMRHHGIVVRHPMERLVSVYRAEFEETHNAETGTTTPAQMSFPDFIELVVHGPEILEQYRRKMQSSQGRGTGSATVDTGLVDGKGLSSHWASYWNQCGLCNPLFDPKYIIHLETLHEDFKIINKEAMDENENVRNILKIKEESVNRPSSDPELLEYYFSQLSKKVIKEIYDKYRVDHELFGYSPDYFIQLGKKD